MTSPTSVRSVRSSSRRTRPAAATPTVASLRRRGGGHKTLPHHRLQARQARHAAKVQAIEYDPNRTALLALLHADGTKPTSSRRGPQGRRHHLQRAEERHQRFPPGQLLPPLAIPPATKLHAVEMIPGKGAQLARAAGTSVELVAMKAATRRSVARARRAWSTPSAAPPSARFPTPITASARSARPAATAGSARPRVAASP